MSVVALTFSIPPKKSATVVWAYLAHGYRTPVSWEYTSIMSGVTPNRRRARFESARYTWYSTGKPRHGSARVTSGAQKRDKRYIALRGHCSTVTGTRPS